MRPQRRIRSGLGEAWPHLFGGGVDGAKDIGPGEGFRGHPEGIVVRPGGVGECAYGVGEVAGGGVRGALRPVLADDAGQHIHRCRWCDRVEGDDTVRVPSPTVWTYKWLLWRPRVIAT